MTDGRELLIEIIALAFTTPSSRGNEFLALVRVRVDRFVATGVRAWQGREPGSGYGAPATFRSELVL